MNDKILYCPNSYLKVGSKIVFYKKSKDSFEFLRNPITVTKSIYEKLYQKKDILSTIRVTNPCEQSGCLNWVNKECNAIKKAMTTIAILEENITRRPVENIAEKRFDACVIKTTCRWHAQEGLAACEDCSFVATVLCDTIT
jgi:hypothetical protein